MPGPVPGLTRIGIRLDDGKELMRLNQRFDDFYLIGFMYGADGTTWYALPKGAPDETITEQSAAALLEALTRDHGTRQEQSRNTGADSADRMST